MTPQTQRLHESGRCPVRSIGLIPGKDNTEVELNEYLESQGLHQFNTANRTASHIRLGSAIKNGEREAPYPYLLMLWQDERPLGKLVDSDEVYHELIKVLNDYEDLRWVTFVWQVTTDPDEPCGYWALHDYDSDASISLSLMRLA